MSKKQIFTVTIEYPFKDGCGNEVPAYTEGEIRRALSKALEDFESISVEEKWEMGRKISTTPLQGDGWM